MKDCYYSRKNRVLRFFFIVTGVLFGGGFITLGLFTILSYGLEDNMVALCGVFIILVGFFMGIECSLQYRLLNRKYVVDGNGLYVQHTRYQKQFYTWNQISQVCLCDIHKGSNEGANKQIKDTVIWCTVSTINGEPPDAKRRWNNSHYGIRYFYSVITIEFSEERLSEFERFYGGIISDYR